MSGQTVAAIMLTRDRPDMTERAVQSFAAQTYPHKRLLIFDTGNESAGYFGDYDHVSHQWTDISLQSWTIGRLRNEAITRAVQCHPMPDLIAHFDSDDISHPRRLEEQVALLQASGKACVGYCELLFWDTRLATPKDPGMEQAWLFRHPSQTYVAGASMMYRREAWESCKFNEATAAEDYHWWLKNASKCLGVSAINAEPRMICGIHGANTSGAYARNKMRPPEWRRAPEWNKYCAERMNL